MLKPPSIAFLKSLLDTPGPSGYEAAAAKVWRAEAETFAAEITADVHGNSMAVVNPKGRPEGGLAPSGATSAASGGTNSLRAPGRRPVR